MSANLNITKLKLGQNADPAKNFLISTPTPEDGTLTIERENGTDVMTVDAAGKVSLPLTPAINNGPAYTAAFTSQIATINGLVLLQMPEETDTANCYSAGRFTPNVAGWYQVSAFAQYLTDGAATYYGLLLRKNGQNATANYQSAYGGLYGSPVCSAILYMNGTTDYIEVWQDINVTGAPAVISSRAGACLLKQG